MTVLGDGTLMPPPDTSCIVVNSSKGFTRQNNSWVLSRILRDWHVDGEDPKHALEVSICSVHPQDVGVPYRDIVWFVGVATIILQCCIAMIPVRLYGSWFILMLTLVGTLLSLAQASLPQWKLKKWSCRMNKSDKTILLTQGNGSRRVIVITSKKGVGFDVEDLASPRTETLASTLPWTIFFCACWLALLLTATGIKQHTWYLMCISSLGEKYLEDEPPPRPNNPSPQSASPPPILQPPPAHLLPSLMSPPALPPPLALPTPALSPVSAISPTPTPPIPGSPASP